MEHQKKTFFFTVFFVHRIVLFCGFLRAPNRAFFWFSSCTKSCFFLVFFVHQIVLFSGFLRAPNRAFFWFSSCTKSCYIIYIYIYCIPMKSAFLLLKALLLASPLSSGAEERLCRGRWFSAGGRSGRNHSHHQQVGQ